MSPRILFSSICGPAPRLLGRYASSDQMAFRLTRDQGPFVLYEHTHSSALHLLAQNISAGSVVLENPTLDQLAEELEAGYDYVAISFKPFHVERLLEMTALIRRRVPATRVIVGGYGAICTPELERDPRWRGTVDHVCHGDGVAFLRLLLGDDPSAEIRCLLPKVGAGLPWITTRPVGTVGVVLSGLGCTQRCSFCVTSASTEGRYVELMSAEQIYRAMRGYWESSPFTISVMVYDENLLLQREKVQALGRLLREDSTFGLSKLNYFAFGSLNALARYAPDELLLNGIDTLWIGVESKWSTLGKCKGIEAAAAFEMLHSCGIKTVGSWIAGQEHQRPETIAEDMEHFVSLDPTFQQISLLGVVPPLELWKQLRRIGRIPSTVGWGDYHLYGETLRFANFSHQELLDHVEGMYRAIYRRQGPALMKALEVNLNGFEWCARARHPLLRQEKARYFRSRCQAQFPLLRTARVHAPSAAVQRRLEALEQRYRDTLGPPQPSELAMAEQLLKRVGEGALRALEACQTVRAEPFRRYTYTPRASRPAGKPYRVAYPQSEPAWADGAEGQAGPERQERHATR